MPIIVLHRWRVWDPLMNRWRTTCYLANEEQIRRQHERYEQIPPREGRQVEPGMALTAGHLQRGYGQKD